MRKIHTKTMIFRFNDDTDRKLTELVEKCHGLFPSKAQAIRSAIHQLYNDKIRDGEMKDDIL